MTFVDNYTKRMFEEGDVLAQVIEDIPHWNKKKGDSIRLWQGVAEAYAKSIKIIDMPRNIQKSFTPHMSYQDAVDIYGENRAKALFPSAKYQDDSTSKNLYKLIPTTEDDPMVIEARRRMGVIEKPVYSVSESPKVNWFGKKVLSKYEEDNDIIDEENDTDKEIDEKLLKTILKAFYSKSKKRINAAIELMVEVLKKRLTIYTWKDDNVKEMWIYWNGVLMKNGECFITQEVRKILGSCYEEKLLNQILNRIRPDTFIDPKEFIKRALNHHYEINVKNCVIIINPVTGTIQTRPQNKSDMFLTKVNSIYDPHATCPVIDAFLADTLRDANDRASMYEAVGTCLDHGCLTKKAMFMIGVKNGGKTTFGRVINHFLGEENCSSLNIKQITEDEYATADLFGMLANISGDSSQEELNDIERFKSITGGDFLQGNRKYKTYIKFMNLAKLWFSYNLPPRVYNADDAYWERVIAWEFVKIFCTQVELDAIMKGKTDAEKEELSKLWGLKDINMYDKLTTPEEMSGFLNKCIEGLIRYYKNKQFSYSKGTDEVKKRWIEMSDSFMAFAMNEIEEGDINGDWITRKNLASEYHKYCFKKNLRMSSDKSIKITLNKQYGVYVDGYTHVPGDNERNWQGIRWIKPEKHGCQKRIEKDGCLT